MDIDIFENFNNQKEIIPSPLNYTGSKFKILPQIQKYFPKNINTFYDIFAGGGSVFINIQHNCNIIVNDTIKPLIDFYKWLQETEWDNIIKKINNKNINKNKKEYIHLREQFNKEKDFLSFFILCCSCTNNMMRFNKSFEFNQTWGNRNFNKNTKKRLKDFHTRLYKNNKITFLNKNFIDLSISANKNNFVYLDPPYIITEAGYNAFWSKELEYELYNFIDNLNNNNIKFMLSNVSEHKGKKNPYLYRIEKYNIINIEHDYNKVSRNGFSKSKEIIVTNY